MLYLFDKYEKLIHDMPSTDLASIIQHEELNKLMTLEFSVFIDKNHKLENIEYVAHKDPHIKDNIQMYRIIGSTSDDSVVHYQAIHIMFDELKSYGYIRDKRPNQVKASSALATVLEGSRWKVGRVDDSELLSFNFYDCTRLDALSKIISMYGMDLSYSLKFNGSKIIGRYINLVNQRGVDTGQRFVYGDKALEVVRELDKSEVYTRIIPRGKGEEKFDEEGKPTDGYGRRINITDVVWSKAKGYPIDKPPGQEYLELEEMTKEFGFSDGKPRTKVQIFEDIEDPEKLIKACYDFLVNVARPLVQFKTKVLKTDRTDVGDIIRIIRKDLNFRYLTRIYKIHRNLLNNTLEVEFGDKLVLSPGERNKIVSSQIKAIEEGFQDKEIEIRKSFTDQVRENLTMALFNQDGFNYEFKKGNKYNLPAGYYSFDKDIDNNPTKVIYVGAGTMAIANSKKSNGDWNFKTFGTGDGFTADLVVAGEIMGGKVRWNLNDGTFIIGEDVGNYHLFWDGSTLHMRNVDIDLSNNKQITNIEGRLENQNKDIRSVKDSVNSQDQKIISMSSDFQVNLDELRTSFDSKFKDIEGNLVNNYSTKIQTSEYFKQTVNKNGIISAINQSAEEVKIMASKINLEGDLRLRGVFEGGSSNGYTSILTGRMLTFTNVDASNKIGNLGAYGTKNSNEYNLALVHEETGNIVFGYQGKDGIYPYLVFDHFRKTKLSDSTFDIVFRETAYFTEGIYNRGTLNFTRYTDRGAVGQIFANDDEDFVINHHAGAEIIIAGELEPYMTFGKNFKSESPIRILEEAEFYKPFKVGKINIGHWSIVYSSDQLQFHNNNSGKVFVLDSSKEASFWG